MIKAFYTVRPFSALKVREDRTYEEETIAYPIHWGPFFTVLNSGTPDNPKWVVRWGKDSVDVPNFGEELFRHIVQEYDYEFEEISFVLQHKLLTDHQRAYRVKNVIIEDGEVDFSCYNLYIYSATGRGRICNLPLVVGCIVDSEMELLEYYQQLAEENPVGNSGHSPLGLWISQVQRHDGYVHWHRLMIRRAIKGIVSKVDLESKTITMHLKDGREFRPMCADGGWIHSWLSFVNDPQLVIGTELLIEFSQSFTSMRLTRSAGSVPFIGCNRTKVVYLDDLLPSIERQGMDLPQALKELETGMLMFQ